MRPLAVFLLLGLVSICIWHSRQGDYTVIWQLFEAREKAEFTRRFIKGTYHPFDEKAIRTLCANTTWIDGLIFSNENFSGGLTNCQITTINYIRLAIIAGGI